MIKKKIANKFFITITLASLVVLAVSLLISFKVMNDIKKDNYKAIKEELDKLVSLEVEAKMETGLTNAVAVASNADILLSISENDKDFAYEILNDIKKKYQNFTEFKNIKVHIHTPDIRSFLRSWDRDNNGDDLSSFRHTIHRVKKTKEPVTAIEVGVAGLILRAIVPIIDEFGYNGSLEYLQGYEAIVKSLKRNGDHLLVFTKQELLRNGNHNQVSAHGLVLSQKEYNESFFRGFKNLDFDTLLNQGYLEDKNFFYSIKPIIGFSKDTIGYYITGEDIKETEKIVAQSLEAVYMFIGILVFLTIVIILVVNFSLKQLVVTNLYKVTEGLKSFFDYLNKKGTKVNKISIPVTDEIGEMARDINENIDIIHQMVEQENKQDWIKEGLNGLNKVLSGNNDISYVSNNSLKYLCEYLNAGIGALYIYNGDDDSLHLMGTYAYIERKELSNIFKAGEGVVGQVALQRSPILLENIKREEMCIDTGTTSEPPMNTYTFPLIYQNELFGVIELGSNIYFDKTQREFFELADNVIATALFSATQNNKVKELLFESQEANKELTKQQKKLEDANNQMQEQQVQLEEANSQLQEQQAQLEEANAQMEEQQVQLKESQKELEQQNKELEVSKEELKRKAKDLESSNRYKSEFLANMSHELRTPLNSIILLSSMLKENKKENLSSDDIKKADIINSSGEELLRLINDVLDLSKVEAGRMEMLVERFDSKGFLNQLKDMFEPACENKGLKFILEDNYKDIISTDKDKLSQVVRNFLSNALKFTHKGFIKLSMEKEGQNRLKVSVQDSGIGIPKDKQQLVFQAFAQVDGSTSRQYGGTGLGLSITKEMVKLMEGEISLHSKEGEGSTFSIVIPNIDSPKKDGNRENETTEEAEKSVRKRFSPADIEQTDEMQVEEIVVDDDSTKITDNENPFLIIEDNLDFAATLKSVINDNDDLAFIAPTGKKGIHIAQNHTNIQGVLLDLGLPDMDGLDVLKYLKSDIKTKKIPVYIISGRDSFDKDKFSDAVGFKQKPLSNEDFKNVFEDFKKFYDKNPLEDVNKFLNTVKNGSRSKPLSVNDVDLSGKKILVADDDMRNTFVLVEILEGKGAQVLTATNGKEALDVLSANKDTNLVLMDIMMPEMDGFEATEKIRADKEIEDIPVVAVTAKAMNQDKERCFESGVNDFLTKPLNLDTFLGVVQAWIK